MEKRSAKGSVYAKKFGIMLDLIPHPDGGRWTGTKMERATGKMVSTSYFSLLRDGHIEIPRADKIEAIAEAMDFPPGLWFKSLSWWEKARRDHNEGRALSTVLEEERGEGDGGRLADLFERLLVKQEQEKGRRLTSSEIADRSGGGLAEGDVESMRSGALEDPTYAQVLALSDAMGVHPAYWSGRDLPRWRPSPALLEAIEGSEAYAIFQNSLKLSGKDRSMLKIMAEHMLRQGEGEGNEREE